MTAANVTDMSMLQLEELADAAAKEEHPGRWKAETISAYHQWFRKRFVNSIYLFIEVFMCQFFS